MADGVISQIQLPPEISGGTGKIYDIKDANVSIDSTYKSNEKEVILTIGWLENADITRY